MTLTIMDTNVLSDLRKTKRHPALLSWLATAERGSLVIAAPSIVEIAQGIASLEERDPVAAQPLIAWLTKLRATERILPLDAAAAELLGRMAAVRALRNLFTTHPRAATPQFGGDIAIAAIAMTESAAVATRNIRDFGLIATYFPDLQVVNPYSVTDP
jgi:predicted nucleic acid-binding protein